MDVHDSLKDGPSVLTNKFDYLNEIHNHNTHTSALYCIKLPISRTLVSGIFSVKGQSASHGIICKQIVHLIACTYDLGVYVKKLSHNTLSIVTKHIT